MFKVLAQLVLAFLLCSPSFAADWVAIGSEGRSSSAWRPMDRTGARRGHPDGQSVRTGPDGRLDLIRGAEKVQLGANTRILLHEGPSATSPASSKASGELIARSSGGTCSTSPSRPVPRGSGSKAPFSASSSGTAWPMSRSTAARASAGQAQRPCRRYRARARSAGLDDRAARSVRPRFCRSLYLRGTARCQRNGRCSRRRAGPSRDTI